MLQGDFYNILSLNKEESGTVSATLRFNREHPIFRGHFPGLPIVPGVCMMQLVKELLEDAVDRRLSLLSAANLKFLSLINPVERPQVDVSIRFTAAEDDTWSAEATISAEGMPYFKLVKARYK